MTMQDSTAPNSGVSLEEGATYRDEMAEECDRLREWQREACEEFEDIRSQWGSDYLWEKHNEKPVVDLLRRAGVEVDG